MLAKRKNRRSLASVFNKYIAVQERTNISDGAGGWSSTWSNVDGYGQEPAAIWPLMGKQLLEYISVNSEVTHMIGLRGYVPIKPPGNNGHSDNRILYNSRIFEILSIEDMREEGSQLILMCKERRK